MLQQTRVAAVGPYFERFLARFPTVVDLAAADEQDVLRFWEGLGYYRRARNLQKAAVAIVDGNGGEFPHHPGAILALPGVGRYTAGAVASFAFGAPEPIVDGNIARVLARLFDFHEEIDSTKGGRQLWEWAAALVPSEGARGSDSRPDGGGADPLLRRPAGMRRLSGSDVLSNRDTRSAAAQEAAREDDAGR